MSRGNVRQRGTRSNTRNRKQESKGGALVPLLIATIVILVVIVIGGLLWYYQVDSPNKLADMRASILEEYSSAEKLGTVYTVPLGGKEIPAGTLITDDMIKGLLSLDVDINTVPDAAIASPDDIVGMVSVIPLSSRSVLTLDMFSEFIPDKKVVEDSAQVDRIIRVNIADNLQGTLKVGDYVDIVVDYTDESDGLTGDYDVVASKVKIVSTSQATTYVAEKEGDEGDDSPETGAITVAGNNYYFKLDPVTIRDIKLASVMGRFSALKYANPNELSTLKTFVYSDAIKKEALSESAVKTLTDIVAKNVGEIPTVDFEETDESLNNKPAEFASVLRENNVADDIVQKLLDLQLLENNSSKSIKELIQASDLDDVTKELLVSYFEVE